MLHTNTRRLRMIRFWECFYPKEAPNESASADSERFWFPGRFGKQRNEIIVTSSNFCLRAGTLNGQSAGGKDPATLKAIQDEVIREFCQYTGCASLWGYGLERTSFFLSIFPFSPCKLHKKML